MSKILCIPDGHTEPAENLDSYHSVGKLIVSARPDYVIIMGDFVSLNSLSHWDADKKLTMEGKRYVKDINAANTALDYLLNPYQEYIDKCNSYWKIGKAKQYNPKFIYLMGNHEFWFNRYIEQNPQMQGHVDIVKDLHLVQRGFIIVPYKQYIDIDNILFTHVPINAAGQPVSGKYALQRALELTSKSVVFAHTHRWEMAAIHRMAGGNLIQALTCGCFFNDTPTYAEGSIHSYWKGITILHTDGGGNFDVEQISKSRLPA